MTWTRLCPKAASEKRDAVRVARKKFKLYAEGMGNVSKGCKLN
jgi:hypothetical protein